MSRPRISRLNIWRRHEDDIISVLFKALRTLLSYKLDNVSENRINRKLYKEIRHRMKLDNLSYIVMYEAANQPILDEAPDEGRERKRPDIQICWTDLLEENPDKYQREYVIECKRLGKPLNKKRILTTEYVTKGIQRFVTKEHGYAKGVNSGAMVGYFQNMEFDTVLTEVNTVAKALFLSPINLSVSGWQPGEITRLEQKLKRSELTPSEFNLRHLWVDFRRRKTNKNC